MNYSSAQQTVFGAAFTRSPPSFPVDARGLRFAAPRAQRVHIEAVGVFQRVFVLGQYGAIDDRLPAVVMDVGRTSVQLERHFRRVWCSRGLPGNTTRADDCLWCIGLCVRGGARLLSSDERRQPWTADEREIFHLDYPAVRNEERRTAGHLQALSYTIANDNALHSPLSGRRTVKRGKGEWRHRKVWR